jgi:hypothetical protein
VKVKRGRSWSKQRVDPRLDIEKFIEEAFKTDRRVRYVGIVDSQFHVLVSKMRQSVTPLTSDSTDRNFVQIMPPIIVEAAEKLQPFFGRVQAITVRYEKLILVFYRMEGYVVVFSFETEVATPFMTRTTEAFLRLSTLSPFDANRFAEESLKFDNKLGSIGVINNENRVLVSRTRETYTPTLPHHEGIMYLSLIPPMVLDAVEKLQPFLGKLHVLVARYDRHVVAFYRLRDMAVVWTFEPEIGTPFMAEITDTFRRLSKQYLST